MGRTIGYDFVVETDSADTVFYAQLARDNTFTRFVKNSEPLHTRYLTMHLSFCQASASYTLNDIWTGRLRPPRPGSPKETTKGNLYWEKHAFVFENQPLQSRSLTKTCPY